MGRGSIREAVFSAGGKLPIISQKEKEDGYTIYTSSLWSLPGATLWAKATRGWKAKELIHVIQTNQPLRVEW